jgi:hypothetical protein
MAFAQPDTPITTGGGGAFSGQTTGTGGVWNWYGSQIAGQENWSQLADIVRSGQLGREGSTLATSLMAQKLGWGRYYDLFPETFGATGGAPQFNQLKNLQGQIADLNSLKQQYANDPNTNYILMWMIDNEIGGLKSTIDRIRNSGRVTNTFRAQESPKLPSWLQPYLESSVPLERTNVTESESRKSKYAKPSTTASLRPLSAQAELSPEQQDFMSSYLAWGKAGSPRTFTKGAPMMSNWQNWWDEYTTLSQSLFPSAGKRKASWATARQ